MTVDAELEAMRIIGSALADLEPAARVRVFSWIESRFEINQTQRGVTGIPRTSGSAIVEESEIPGVARLTDAGHLEITVRDLKAKSATDAAIRLAHIVLLAKEKLTGSKTTSSRKELTPILKQWRVYDGNTRAALGQHKGIHRKDDELSLDAISRQEAESYIAQVLDDSIHGPWNPVGRGRKTARRSATVKSSSEIGNGS